MLDGRGAVAVAIQHRTVFMVREFTHEVKARSPIRVFAMGVRGLLVSAMFAEFTVCHIGLLCGSEASLSHPSNIE